MDLEPQLCRLCLVPVDPAMVVVLNQAVNLIESILQLTTVNVIIDPLCSVFMCDKCQNTLDLAIQFRTMCLQNDNTFRKMHAKHSSLDGVMGESDDWGTGFVLSQNDIDYHNHEMKLEVELNIQDNETLDHNQQSSLTDVKTTKPRKKNRKRLKIGEQDQEHKTQLSTSEVQIGMLPKKCQIDPTADEQSPSKSVKAKKPRKRSKIKQKPPPNGQPLKVQCQFCGGFFCREYLSVHLLQHKEDRPVYACEQCPNKYSYRKNLKEHIEIVHERKGYTCDQCGKTFNRKEILQRHHIAEHTDIKKINHTNLRPYACEFCPMTFKRRTDLTLHTRTHTGEKPFKCDLCDKRFSKSYNVVIHKKSHKNAEMRLAAQELVVQGEN